MILEDIFSEGKIFCPKIAHIIFNFMVQIL